MGRKPRVEYEGAIYHVIQRGNNKEYILENEDDKLYLLDQIKECKSGTGLGFQLYGYVIMGNHYHLLVQTVRTPLNRIMHRINSSFGRYYNRRYQRSGHVFQGRYKAILVQDERYLLAVLRYIHHNPVRADLCGAITDYRFSSDAYYRHHQRGFVDTDLILSSLARNRSRAVAKYTEIMEMEDDANYDQPDTIGDVCFALAFLSRVRVPERKRLDEILIDTVPSFDDYLLIKAGSRCRHLTHYKRLYIEQAMQEKYTLREIGDNIGLSEPAVFRLVQPMVFRLAVKR